MLDVLGYRVPRVFTALFLLLAVLTSATGFGFPFNTVLPSHIVGALALIVLAATLYARYAARTTGIWRSVYVIGIVTSAFFLVFVGVVQAFRKIPALNALAPTESEPPFAIAQTVVLLVFVVIGVLAVKRYRPAAIAPVMHPGQAAA